MIHQTVPSPSQLRLGPRDLSRGRAFATIGDNSIGDSHGVAKGRRAGSGPSDNDDTPSAIKTAARQRWTGKAKAGEKQDTGLDPETAAGHGDLPSSFVSIAGCISAMSLVRRTRG